MSNLPAILTVELPNKFYKKLLDIRSLPSNQIPSKRFLKRVIENVENEPKAQRKTAILLANQLLYCYPVKNDPRVEDDFFCGQVVQFVDVFFMFKIH